MKFYKSGEIQLCLLIRLARKQNAMSCSETDEYGKHCLIVKKRCRVYLKPKLYSIVGSADIQPITNKGHFAMSTISVDLKA